MKKIILSLVVGSFLVGCINKNGQTEDQVKASIIKLIPGLPNDVRVTKSPINGVYEILAGRKVFYVSNDGKYLIFGNMIEASSKENLTEKRTQEISKMDWNQLPLDLAIKVVNGNGKRQLAVFSDPDCPYCRLFEQKTVPDLKDTTVYTFLFPLPMHPSAKDDSKKVWCSMDRATTWTAWMKDKKALPTKTDCDTSGLDRIYKIGTDVVQVEGTPTLVLSNGQLLSGALPADQLLSMMDEAAGKSSTSANKSDGESSAK